MQRLSIVFLLACALLVFGSPLAQAEEFVFGRELMTQEELTEHRAKMRTLTGEEREAYRLEHHEKMQERAKQRGVTIPDEPAIRGKGMLRGGGMGQGRGGRR